MILRNGFYQLVTLRSVTSEFYLVYRNKVYSCCCGELEFDEADKFYKYLRKEGKDLRYSKTLPARFKPGLDKINERLGTSFGLIKL